MEDLARLSIKNKPVYVGVDDAEQESTVDGLEQVRLAKELRLPSLRERRIGEISVVFALFRMSPRHSTNPPPPLSGRK